MDQDIEVSASTKGDYGTPQFWNMV